MEMMTRNISHIQLGDFNCRAAAADFAHGCAAFAEAAPEKLVPRFVARQKRPIN